MVLTFEDVAKFDQLEHDRYRVLAQGYTTSQIPINADHEKWLEYKEFKKRLNSPQSRAAPGNEHAAAQPASPPLTNLMAMTRSTFPNQEQNMMLDLLLGSASRSLSLAHASGPQPHLWMQAMAPILADSPYCKCHHIHEIYPSCWDCSSKLAHSLLATHQHGLEGPGASASGTTSVVIEQSPEAETDRAVMVEDEDDGDENENDDDNDDNENDNDNDDNENDNDNDDNENDDNDDEAGKESAQICLDLEIKSVDVSAAVARDSPVNWISKKFLGESSITPNPTKYVAYQVPAGIRLESNWCVKLFWRRSIRGKVFLGEFAVHEGGPRAPDVILGRSWARIHGGSVLLSQNSDTSIDRNAQRRSEKGLHGELPRVRSGAQSLSQRTMELTERQRINRRVVKSSRH